LLPTVSTEQSSPVLWYLTRATASAAYVALLLATMCGMLRGIARGTGAHLSWTVDELHQALSTCFGGLVVLHLVTLYYHTFIPFTLGNFLWPGSQPYRPFAVNLGVLGLYTMGIIFVSSWIRRRLSYRTWRWLHYLSFATFVLVTLHGLLAGSDAGEPWMRALYAGAAAAVGFLLLMRLLTSFRGVRTALESTSEPEQADPSMAAPSRTQSLWSPEPEEEEWQPVFPDKRPIEILAQWEKRRTRVRVRQEEEA
jgi:hypothetical protein